MNDSELRHRYSRQINLEVVGLEGQLRLRSARVLIVGVGGLGAPVALYLAAAGVGCLGLIDPDVVDPSNLQRQILYSFADAGRSKVEVAAQHLKALNPELVVNTYQDYFHAENAQRVLAEYDLVVDGSDNFGTKFLVCDAAHRLGLPMVYGAVDQFEGQVGIFNSRLGACYRCLYPQEPKANIRNCAEAGVLGSLVGVIGSMQATLTLNWIIAGGHIEHPLYPKLGKMLILRLDDFEFLKFVVPKKVNCQTCSKSADEVELKFTAPLCTSINEINWFEACELVRNQNVGLFDVRERDEWEAGHLDGAHHLPLSDLLAGRISTASLGDWLKQDSLFYCQKGLRSLDAIKLLTKQTTCKMYSLRGGLDKINS
jgi:adenylyltransferase/sulfurtransferase